MIPVVRAQDMVTLEASIVERGQSLSDLMEQAGYALARGAAQLCSGGPIVVLCGSGNNGGDGWVAADDLAKRGFEIHVVTPVAPQAISSELARTNAMHAMEVGLPVYVSPSTAELARLFEHAEVVIDAMLGTGSRGEMREPYSAWTRLLQEYPDILVVVADIASGLDAETGLAGSMCIQADLTVAMIAYKPGHLSNDGPDFSGELMVADLTSEYDLIELAALGYSVEIEDMANALPKLQRNADKYSRGTVLVVSGSSQYPGAAVLAAMAAARSGAGYVTLAVPQSIAALCQMKLDTIPVVALPQNSDGTISAQAIDTVLERAARSDCVLCGPGLGVAQGPREVVKALLESECALVLDADAITLVSQLADGSLLNNPQVIKRAAPLVLTPHVSEFERLVGKGNAGDQTVFANRIFTGRDLHWAIASPNLSIITKGPETAAIGDGIAYIVEPGPAALATAGTGDVLAGIIASLIAQDAQQPEDLALLCAAAVHVHAQAAWLAIEEVGAHGLIASDLIGKVGLAADNLQDASMTQEFIEPDDVETTLADFDGREKLADELPGADLELEEDA